MFASPPMIILRLPLAKSGVLDGRTKISRSTEPGDLLDLNDGEPFLLALRRQNAAEHVLTSFL